MFEVLALRGCNAVAPMVVLCCFLKYGVGSDFEI